MKRALIVAGAVLAIATALPAVSAWAHEESRVAVETEGSGQTQAGEITFEFELLDLKQKVVLVERDLAIVHEKPVHMFIFDPAFKEFRHEHPVFNGEKWQATTNLSVDGNYWVWVQGKIAADGDEFSSSARLKVVGGSAPNPVPPTLGDVRTGSDGTSKITFSAGKIVAKKMVMLNLTFSRTDGTTPNLTPYLGEMAHVLGTTVLSDGDGVLVHTHPMAGGNPNELMVHATFPQPGNYRLWVQFIDDNVLKTIPLSVNVVRK